MKPCALLCAALTFAPLCSSSAEFKLGVHTFTLPEGFTVEKVAGPRLVDRPIVADFDDEGRLYVAESSGSNDPVDKQLKEKPHRIVRLEDTNGDGVFDKSVVYADKMMFPEGAMWLDGSLYVSAPPVIWKLTDTDGDGVADKREEWLDAKTLTGCANDLHGPYRGLDGWIYWCKGAFAKQSYEQPGSVAFETRAAHIFRRRPEGGPVEAVMTGGMDNPVDVTFTPEGERIFTTTFFQHPGGGQRDGLVHAIYGGVYGKVHDVIDDHKKTGDLMPVLTHLGPAAPAGLTRYASEAFGAGYRNNLFAALFNLHKVTRHVLKPRGATYQTEDSDFLVSDNTDFHPTDVIEDADGSLLVIDTGGWYKLCCPTSQLWKPDVLGAIYRIRRTGSPKISDPRGTKINWTTATPAELARLLDDARPAVARHAIQQLRKTAGSVSVLSDILQSNGSERQKLNAVWALASNKDQATAPLHSALSNASPTIKHAALHALSVTPDRVEVAQVAKLLSPSEPAQVQRAAAEVLGRTQSANAVPALLQAAGWLEPATGKSVPDRVQEHSIIYALIEINTSERTRPGLVATNSFTTRAALIALDQMSADALKPSDVLPLLDADETVLAETADWIISHRADWGGELAAYFKKQLNRSSLSRADLKKVEDQLLAHVGSLEIQQLVAEIASDVIVPSDNIRHVAFQVLANARLKETPASWVTAVVTTMNTPGTAHIVNAALAASRFNFKERPAELKSALLKTINSGSLPNGPRLEVLASIANGLKLEDSLFEYLRTQLNDKSSPAERRHAITALGRASLTEPQLRALLDNLKQSNPIDFTQLLAIYEKPASEALGHELISALKQSRAISALSSGDQLQRVFVKYPESVKRNANELYASINVDATRQSARVEEMLPKLSGGDVRRGQAIFNSQAAACSSCHAIGYLGGNVGPDLTRVGQVRTERDLLEAILYPSASFVRSYEPVVIETTSGDLHNGILKKDAADELILATGPGAEVRVARSEIADMRPGKVSVMPQGLDQQLTPQQLADLVAFLRATR
jgi:putative membrane-bound dehydrogenase-like protein